MQDICQFAVDVAGQRGATYADARVVRFRNQVINTEDQRVAGIDDSESSGLGVRVIADGAWGFACTAKLDRPSVEAAAGEAVRIAKASALAPAPKGLAWAEEPACQDTYRSPMQKDPFDVALEDKVQLLLAINRAAGAVKGVTKATGTMRFRREHRFLANSEGTRLESEVTASTASYTAHAVGTETTKTRSFEAYPASAGYEHIEATPLLDEATRVGEQAVAQLQGKPCPVGRRDLVLDPSHLMLTMHESIGHATELDRVLGMEESLAGSSFATVDQLGKLQYGSPLMNIIADNTLPVGLATRGWDDDGVAGQRWHLIRDGVLVDYQTSRDVCGAIGATRSRGSCRADSWASIPIVRQSNLGLAPGPEPLRPEELIADTKEGIYIEGRGSFSIDQKRQNFQFGGDCFWEIKDGKLGAILKDVTYQAITTEFWGALDAICDDRFWVPHGVQNCGKGDPMQIAQMTHGSAPARFRQINVGGAG